MAIVDSDIIKTEKGADQVNGGTKARVTMLGLIAYIENKLMTSNTIKTTTVALVAGTRQQLPPSPIINRKSIIITNNSSTDVWYGDNGVTVGTGTILRAGEKNSLNLRSGLFAISNNTVTLQVNELS